VSLYTIKAGDCEYQLVSWSIDAVTKVARQKVWQIAPGEKVLVYRGTKLIGELTRHGLFDEADGDGQ
jgi:hypothetical protein